MEGSTFNREQRIDLFRLVTDLFPPPKLDYMAGETGGDELYQLKDALERTLHRLPSALGHGGIEAWTQSFILGEPDDVLLTLIELMPFAQALADDKKRREPHGWAFSDLDTNQKVIKITKFVNSFLETTTSHARFGKDGRFSRQAFAIEVPPALRQLPNRDALLNDIAGLLKDSGPVSVIFIDLDEFKSVNDQFGHPAGDRCLERAVEIIGSAIAHKGRLYRYGGDEFAAVLPNFQTAEAAPTAERIRLSIEKANPGGGGKITASIGVVSSEQPCGNDAKVLVDAADKAGYASKRGGKNRVTVWQPEVG
jgi:diguanylate cyclase (GGDEF)-like protein